jgi:hypothetical protein
MDPGALLVMSTKSFTLLVLSNEEEVKLVQNKAVSDTYRVCAFLLRGFIEEPLGCYALKIPPPHPHKVIKPGKIWRDKVQVVTPSYYNNN